MVPVFLNCLTFFPKMSLGSRASFIAWVVMESVLLVKPWGGRPFRHDFFSCLMIAPGPRKRNLPKCSVCLNPVTFRQLLARSKLIYTNGKMNPAGAGMAVHVDPTLASHGTEFALTAALS